jgi:ABC-type glycerol-3-phosphate transport system substrate-binding protein
MRCAHIIAIGIVLLTTISACVAAPAPPTPDDTSPPVTITFAAPETERAVFEPLISAFHQQHPDIRVQFVPQPVNAPLPQIVRLADTAVVAGISATDWSTGVVRDLAPYIATDQSFDPADYFPAALPQTDGQVGIACLPHTLSVPLLQYNADLWARHVGAAPQSDWTGPDLLLAADQLAQRRGDQVSVYGWLDGSGGLDALEYELRKRGIDFPASQQAAPRLDDPEVGAALDQVVDAAAAGVIYLPEPDSVGGFDWDGAQQQIRAGQIAIWPAELLLLDDDTSTLSFPVATVVAPEAQPIASGGYVISGGSLYPDQAWRWLAFLSRQTLPAAPADGTALVPARRSLAQTAQGSGAMITLEALQPALDRPAIPIDDLARASAWREALAPTLPLVVRRQHAADAALRTAQLTLDQQPARTPEVADVGASPVVVATPAPTPVADVTAITFNFLPWLMPERPLIGVAERFEREHPEIDVRLRNLDNSLSDIDIASLAEGADCFIGPSAPTWGYLDILRDVQPLMDADADFVPSDYPAGLLGLFQYNGGMYGLPFDASAVTLMYDKRVFDAMGVRYPTAEWTPDTLLHTAAQLTTQQEPRQYGFVGSGTSTPETVMKMFGTQHLQRREEVVQALRFYVDLLRVGSPHRRLYAYGPEIPHDEETYPLQRQRRVGMWLASDVATGRFVDGEYRAQPDFGVAPLPLNRTTGALPLVGTNGLFITSTTPAAAACWTWLTYVSEDVTLYQGTLPARRSVAQSEAFRAQAGPEAVAVYEAYADLFDRASTGPPARRWPDMFWFYRAIDRALQGADLERELQAAQQLTEQYLTCVQAGGAGAVCATQVDPAYAGGQQLEATSEP